VAAGAAGAAGAGVAGAEHALATMASAAITANGFSNRLVFCISFPSEGYLGWLCFSLLVDVQTFLME
jgi:hypothetical protein